MSLAALPDFRLTIDDQIAEGGVVVTHWSAKGTQHGPLFGIPPTSRSVTAVAVHIDHLADGRIIDQWEEFGTLGDATPTRCVRFPSSGESGAPRCGAGGALPMLLDGRAPPKVRHEPIAAVQRQPLGRWPG